MLLCLGILPQEITDIPDGFAQFVRFRQKDQPEVVGFRPTEAGTIDDEVKSLVDRAYADCEAILRRDADKLTRVVEYLLAHETMSGSQFEQCMQGQEITEDSSGSLFDAFKEE